MRWQSDDYWIALDKWAHFAGTFFWTVWLTVLMPSFVAVLIANLCGFVLEVWQDATGRDRASWKDMIANFAGSIIAVVALWLLRR